jgi:hypothetical protein
VAEIAGVVFAALACASLVPDAERSRWLPVGVGRRWVYDVEVYELRGGGAPHARRLATLTQEVTQRVDAEGDAAGRVELRIERRAPGAGGETRRVQRTWLAAESGAVREVGRGEGEAAELVLHETPLLWIPSDAGVGRRWHVGRVPLADSAAELDAEAVGRATVATPAGSFPDCLEVHYSGALAEEPASPGAAQRGPRLAGGRIEGREWLAAGVGPVKWELVRELWLDDGAGSLRVRRQRETRVLRAHRAGRWPWSGGGSVTEPPAGSDRGDG